jgi:hypothetical protein
MIKFLDQSRENENILCPRASGTLHEKDYAEFLPKLEELFAVLSEQTGLLRLSSGISAQLVFVFLA